MQCKMRKVTFAGEFVNYPVGSNIANAISFMENAALKFTAIKEFKNKSINIWCRGSSGAILAALFASNLLDHRVKICHVKKIGELSHDDGLYPMKNGIHIIVDDFVCTGTTLNAIYKEIIAINSNYIVECLVIGTTSETKKRKKIPRLLTFTPKILITNK